MQHRINSKDLILTRIHALEEQFRLFYKSDDYTAIDLLEYELGTAYNQLSNLIKIEQNANNSQTTIKPESQSSYQKECYKC